jgi:RNA polymerase sigma-70 factor, ECF subfamily
LVLEAALMIDRPLTPQNANWQTATDAVLLAASAERNQQAFAVLVQRYHVPVYRVAWRLNGGHVDTDDITQETFLKLWNNPGQLREAAALKGWLMRVASNLVMDRYRRKPMLELEHAEDVADAAISAPTLIDQSYVTKKIDAAIASLPDRQKLALALVHFEHMTNIAAAATMEISVEALESLLARARRGLKEKLGEGGRHLLATLATEEE